MAQITRELNEIQNGRYGHQIRMQIYTCLDRINQQLEAQDAGEDPESEYDDREESEDNAGYLTGT